MIGRLSPSNYSLNYLRPPSLALWFFSTVPALSLVGFHTKQYSPHHMSGANSYIQKGVELLRAGDLRNSEQFFSAALEVLPSSASAYFYRADTRWKMGRQLDSVVDIEKAISLDPSNEHINLGAIKLLRAINRQDLALELGFKFLNSGNVSNIIYKQILELRGLMDKAQELTNSKFLNRAESYIERELIDRITVVNYCIERFGYKKYLEIGCHDNGTFNSIDCVYKVGVDPIQGGTLRMTSDEYFALTNDAFDLIFIDGLHHCEQVYKDVKNSLLHLNPGGTIVMHDCLPKEETHQRREPVEYVWNGDVWKAFALFRQDPNLDAVVGDFDNGIGVIRVRKNSAPVELGKSYYELDWNDFVKNRGEWLRPKSSGELKGWI